MLHRSFFNYMETTSSMLCYGRPFTPSLYDSIVFPHVESLTLLKCCPFGINAMLRRKTFPSLRRIIYLSSPPLPSFDLHVRFPPTVEWVFPLPPRRYESSSSTPFYDRMVESGRGKREAGLIAQHVAYLTVDDIGLYTPLYGVVCGTWWCHQQYAYLTHKKAEREDEFQDPYSIIEDEDFHKKENGGGEEGGKERWRDMDRKTVYGMYETDWLEKEIYHQINHLDATPYHNSSM